MKVKLFLTNEKLFKKDQSSVKLEDEINSWLENHSEIKIVKIKQSSCGGSMDPAKHLISVWYDSLT
ncbi:MAG: hypothetical protein ISR83_09675 [Candidatus Marinimicrobia bacterium]|nr:hypothetical protein [Candidatus Neomarinimicrobiota bacterium]